VLARTVTVCIYLKNTLFFCRTIYRTIERRAGDALKCGAQGRRPPVVRPRTSLPRRRDGVAFREVVEKKKKNFERTRHFFERKL
jgi:hypothetical protein